MLPELLRLVDCSDPFLLDTQHISMGTTVRKAAGLLRIAHIFALALSRFEKATVYWPEVFRAFRSLANGIPRRGRIAACKEDLQHSSYKSNISER